MWKASRWFLHSSVHASDPSWIYLNPPFTFNTSQHFLKKCFKPELWRFPDILFFFFLFCCTDREVPLSSQGGENNNKVGSGHNIKCRTLWCRIHSSVENLPPETTFLCVCSWWLIISLKLWQKSNILSLGNRKNTPKMVKPCKGGGPMNESQPVRTTAVNFTLTYM